jgi:hypothetical protein
MAREPQKSGQNAGKTKSEIAAKAGASEGNPKQKPGADTEAIEGAAEFLTASRASSEPRQMDGEWC